MQVGTHALQGLHIPRLAPWSIPLHQHTQIIYPGGSYYESQTSLAASTKLCVE